MMKKVKTIGECKAGDSLFCYWASRSSIEERKVVKIIKIGDKLRVFVDFRNFTELWGKAEPEQTVHGNYFTTLKEAEEKRIDWIKGKIKELQKKKRTIDSEINIFKSQLQK